MILNSITNLAITWDVFTWSKQAHKIRFIYFFVHHFIIIMHHAFKHFDESLFKDLLSVVSCFEINGSKFWETHCILMLSQYLVKIVLYITESSLYLWFDLEVCSVPNCRFLRSSITLRTYLLPNRILEKYDIFFVLIKSLRNWNRLYLINSLLSLSLRGTR